MELFIRAIDDYHLDELFNDLYLKDRSCDIMVNGNMLTVGDILDEWYVRNGQDGQGLPKKIC